AGYLYIPKKNLNNQTVIVTGAASGIGRVTALELAKLQAHVIVGIRGQERAECVAQQLSNESHGNVIGYHLDLSDLASVKAFAEKIDKVDILINNAGVNKKNKELTKDGLESTFGTNHIIVELLSNEDINNCYFNLFYSNESSYKYLDENCYEYIDIISLKYQQYQTNHLIQHTKVFFDQIY
ncbi:unnamed protein product, partial [Rotaria sp. Silwood1]